MIDQATLFTVAGAAALIWAIIQTFVKAIPALPARWYPVLALLVGPVLVPLLDMGLNNHPWSWSMVVLGLLAGLAAPGSHEVLSAFTSRALDTLGSRSTSTSEATISNGLGSARVSSITTNIAAEPVMEKPKRLKRGGAVASGGPTDSSGPSSTPS